MLLLGIDIGTSSVKVSVVDAVSQKVLVSAQFPETESPIKSIKTGWAEQSPYMWWEQAQKAILMAHQEGDYNPGDIAAIGIAYQMHGLVIIDKDQQPLRDSIIWCDSRTAPIGDQAFREIGETRCLAHLLNSPGNFTASKLAWVKQNEPDIYAQIDKIMLPGDYIAMKLTGDNTTSISALSEGIFYDFLADGLSADVTGYFGFDKDMFPAVMPVFAEHGHVSVPVAKSLKLKPGIPVTYKAGDQPNNALSLNVLKPGEVAATAGTSGVIYGVSDQLAYDKQSRVNTFAHVNYKPDDKKLGVLLCINGTGSLNRWVKNTFGQSLAYQEMNDQAAMIKEGSGGLRILPFGNGAERILNNKIVGAHLHNIDVNLHSNGHVFRAAQEGIACAFNYGLDVMRENGMSPNIIRAGKANLFLSDVFTQSFVNVTGVPVELYDTDGSIGAAKGAGIGSGIYKDATDAFHHSNPIKIVEPAAKNNMASVYREWKIILEKQLQIS